MNHTTQSFTVLSLQTLLEKQTEKSIRDLDRNVFRIIWIIDGKGKHWIDLDRLSIQPGVVFFIKPGQIYLLEPEEEISGYYISFSWEFISNSNFIDGIRKEYILSHNGMLPRMIELIDAMQRETTQSGAFKNELTRGLLKIFLIYMMRGNGPVKILTPPNKQVSLVNDFLKLLEQQFRTLKRVSEYANALFISSNYLNETVKQVTGFPTRCHIQHRIILEAKRLVVFSNLPLKQIAYDLGFDDIAHFSKYFKKMSGTTFTDFKSCKNKLCQPTIYNSI